MGPSGQSGAARGRRLSYPYLMECDRGGRVLWMSEYTRATLGASANLIGTIPNWHASNPNPQGRPAELVFTRLLELGGTVLVGARPIQPAEKAPEEHEAVLLRLQGRLSLQYFRLLNAERRLARHARHRRPSGIRALRQIELERERLGRELHTSVGQQLSAIRLQAETIASEIAGNDSPAREAVDRIFMLTTEALEQVRSVSKRLHPPEWQRLSLAAALEQLWELSGIPQRFEASLHIGPLPHEPELEIKILLYRAAQEALSNLIRHSQATRVEAVLAEHAGDVVLTFRDNGVGFDAARLFVAAATISGGIGLRSIRDQAESLGAKLTVASGPAGTTLEITAPFQPAES